MQRDPEGEESRPWVAGEKQKLALLPCAARDQKAAAWQRAG